MTFRPFRVRLSSFVFALATAWQLGLSQETKWLASVNSFQNFSAADQQVIVEQLKRSEVRFVRTSLRPDDKNTAKAAQEKHPGLVQVYLCDISWDRPVVGWRRTDS